MRCGFMERTGKQIIRALDDVTSCVGHETVTSPEKDKRLAARRSNGKDTRRQNAPSLSPFPYCFFSVNREICRTDPKASGQWPPPAWRTIICGCIRRRHMIEVRMEPKKKARSSNLVAILLVGAAALAGYYFLGGKDHWPFGKPAQQAGRDARRSGPGRQPWNDRKTIAGDQDRQGGHARFPDRQTGGRQCRFQPGSCRRQVSSPYQGRIIQVFANLGERVTRGQPLFTIESPDLLAAESTLIQTAGVAELTSQ